MTPDSDRTLVDIGRAIERAIATPTSAQRHLLAQIHRQISRITENVFQLAVLGQFKRGKSTLLNALVGCPLLSSGVLPLTSVPTFLALGTTNQIRLVYISGAVEQHEVDRLEALSSEIAAATTEEQNPSNERGLQRAEVGIASSGWLEAVTLIDTPGIGSTNIHNTDAAYAVLPECDAALFVCSIDPPITEVELKYLSHVCSTVSRVILVLNKVDLADAEDQEKALSFLSAVVAKLPVKGIDRRVFPLSAREALAARQSDDQQRLEASGLPALERYLQVNLIDQKKRLLSLSIRGKMTDAASALAADAAMTANALSLPLTEIDAKVRIFEQAVAGFDRERTALEDSVNGEWKRAIERLAGLCEQARMRTARELESAIANTGSCDDLERARAVVTSAMSEILDRELRDIGETVEAELSDAIEARQRRYHVLAARVRETAGGLFNVSAGSGQIEDWFEIRKEPYWLGERRIDSLSSLTVDGLARLLPGSLRERRQRRKFREGVRDALRRNIADLEWTMRQNIDDSFRRLLSNSKEAVESEIQSTRELMRMARERRAAEGASLQQEIERARFAERNLAHLVAALRGESESAPQQSKQK